MCLFLVNELESHAFLVKNVEKLQLKVRTGKNPFSKYSHWFPLRFLLNIVSLCRLEPVNLKDNHMDVGDRVDLSAHCCSGLKDLAQVRRMFNQSISCNAYVLAGAAV